ncbi:MAG: hypothetical protein M1837_001899 [Sclerophora amabilis]|nr:MAG: hypothetical protein M1837_001899 [Sclerophora amabilis]
MALTGTEKHRWWKEAVVYQVYPSSFLDSNGDGWGDLPGITSKLDYLKDLGVDILWSSPICKSPQADMGYDISDYKAIDPIYGTLQDVDHLIAELKKRDMKLMMDVVFNHTSDQHAWFLESRASVDNPKRDWYIWKKPKIDKDGNREPPNNWCQILGDAKSAWTYDEKTEEYYLSLFTPEQPDLNWETPDVRAAVHDVMLFWLERGACGFRMDVINLISKDQSFPDAPISVPDQKYQLGTKFFANGPRLHEYLREIHQKVLSKYDTITVGEMPWVSDVDEILKVVGSKGGELDMIFIFDIVDIDGAPGQPRFSEYKWTLRDLKRIVKKWQRTMIERDGWNSLFVENHDNPRSVSRYVDDSDEFRDRGAKLLALMQTTLSGTLYVYQGEELGMRNAPLSWEPEEYKDVEARNLWKKYTSRYPNDPSKLKEGRRLLQSKARDHARLPMQWSSAPNAGFCPADAKPWMRINDDWTHLNAAAQMSSTPDATNPLSNWQYWKRGLAARKEHKDVFVYGDFEMLDEAHERVLAYLRTGEEAGTWIIVLNFSGHVAEWQIPEGVTVTGWMASTYDGAGGGKPDKSTAEVVQLDPWEGLLGKCA